MNAVADKGNWGIRWTLQKFHEDLAEWEAKYGREEGQRRFYEECTPYEERVIEGNLLVNVGIQLMEDLLVGAGGTVYNNANARIGVGDSNTAAAASQIDLQAASNKLRKAMDATFPSRAAQTLSFKSSFTGAEANYAWQEWGVFNSATANVGMLNRKVEALGTKTTGTWTLQADISIT